MARQKPKQKSGDVKKTPQEQSTTTSNSPWRQILSTWPGIIGSIIVALIGVYGTSVVYERNELKTKQAQWRFSESFYKKIPSDIDFLARGLRVDKKEGSSVGTIGPGPGDSFVVKVSKLVPAPKSVPDRQTYQLLFIVYGSNGGNTIIPVPIGPVAAKANELVGPIDAVVHQFYLFIERVEVDYVFLTVARRRINTSIGFLNVTAPLNMKVVSDQLRPENILLASPEPD